MFMVLPFLHFAWPSVPKLDLCVSLDPSRKQAGNLGEFNEGLFKTICSGLWEMRDGNTSWGLQQWGAFSPSRPEGAERRKTIELWRELL